MLNPSQLHRLRKLIEEESEVSLFEGYRIEAKEIGIHPDGADLEPILREPASEEKMYAPVHIFGTPFDRSCLNGIGNHTINTSEKILYRYKNCTIVGNQSFIGTFGLAAPSPIIEQAAFDRFCRENKWNHHGFAINRAEEELGATAYFVAAERKRDISGVGLFIHDAEPGNYGSFLFRALPQLLFIAENRHIHFDFYITPSRTNFFREALRLLNLPNRPVLNSAEIAGDNLANLLVCNDFNNEGWLDQVTLARLRMLMIKVQRATTADRVQFSKNLYISRRLGGGSRPNYRRLINEDEVEAALRARGFSAVHPETLTFADQILLFAEAAVIIGPSGSGMLNSMFAPPDIKILDMESHHGTVRQHAKIYSSTGKTYSFLFGELAEFTGAAMHAKWNVDLDLLRQATDWVVQ